MVAIAEKNLGYWRGDCPSGVGLDPADPRQLIAPSEDLVELQRERIRISQHHQIPATCQVETAEEKFDRLAPCWRKETAHQSSVHAIALHSAYQEIIGMGWAAVPLMLQALEQGTEHWFWALRSITGVSPIKEADRGNMEAMAQAWVRWGKDRGYL